jgi:hypothetical protein
MRPTVKPSEFVPPYQPFASKEQLAEAGVTFVSSAGYSLSRPEGRSAASGSCSVPSPPISASWSATAASRTRAA